MHADREALGADRLLLAENERLTAAHLTGEQEHRLQRVRRHLRLLHGWGVVCGLGVVPAGDLDHPWAVVVCPGYALGPHGDEILLERSVSIDIRESAWRAPQLRPSHAYVAVRYAETPAAEARVRPGGCEWGACADPHPTRIRDGFAVNVLWEPPPVGPGGPDPCRPGPHACPDCPTSPYVVLVCVDLPEDEATPITAAHIRSDECHAVRPRGEMADEDS